jgi:hypothetical protein
MLKLLKVLIFFVLFAGLIFCIDYFSNKGFDLQMDVLKLRGKVSSKYIDIQDHNRPKITIIDNQDSITLDLANESSGLYEYIHVGDSIFKTKNSRKVRVFNINKDSSLIMTF